MILNLLLELGHERQLELVLDDLSAATDLLIDEYGGSLPEILKHVVDLVSDVVHDVIFHLILDLTSQVVSAANHHCIFALC